MAVITLIMTFVVLVVTLLSCVADVRFMRIPNWHALVILGCFIPAWLAMPSTFGNIWYHAGALAAMFVITYIMFCSRMIGGGDAKLGTALALWTGLKGLAPFMLYMAIMGGVLGLAAILLRKRKLFNNPSPGSWVGQAQNGRSAVPYGVAISVGAWAAFFHTGFVHNQLNEVFRIIH